MHYFGALNGCLVFWDFAGKRDSHLPNPEFRQFIMAFQTFLHRPEAWHKKCTTMLNFLFATNLSRRI